MTRTAYSIKEHFGGLRDPRYRWNVVHNLEDIVSIAICGAICGADDWVAIAAFGEAKEGWLRTFLAIPRAP